MYGRALGALHSSKASTESSAQSASVTKQAAWWPKESTKTGNRREKASQNQFPGAD